MEPQVQKLILEKVQSAIKSADFDGIANNNIAYWLDCVLYKLYDNDEYIRQQFANGNYLLPEQTGFIHFVYTHFNIRVDVPNASSDVWFHFKAKHFNIDIEGNDVGYNDTAKLSLEYAFKDNISIEQFNKESNFELYLTLDWETAKVSLQPNCIKSLL